MQDAIDGQYISGDRGVRILADAITTLSDAMRSRLELVERGEDLALSALTALGELVKERLEAVDRNQQLLLEAVGALQWRLELHAGSDEASQAQALEAEMRDALRWTRPDAEPPPFVIHMTR